MIATRTELSDEVLMREGFLFEIKGRVCFWRKGNIQIHFNPTIYHPDYILNNKVPIKYLDQIK